MRTEQELYQLILDYAWKDDRIRGVILNGSRANPTAPLDRFRDFDIVYLVTDVEPVTDMEKSIYTVDELSGLIAAAARVHPAGIAELKPSSVRKKFKDKRFAAKIDRAVIQDGCDRLGMELSDVIALCIEGMKPFAAELGIGPRA